jgi:hypothetical protein
MFNVRRYLDAKIKKEKAHWQEEKFKRKVTSLILIDKKMHVKIVENQLKHLHH